MFVVCGDRSRYREVALAIYFQLVLFEIMMKLRNSEITQPFGCKDVLQAILVMEELFLRDFREV